MFTIDMIIVASIDFGNKEKLIDKRLVKKDNSIISITFLLL